MLVWVGVGVGKEGFVFLLLPTLTTTLTNIIITKSGI